VQHQRPALHFYALRHHHELGMLRVFEKKEGNLSPSTLGEENFLDALNTPLADCLL